MSLSNDEFLLYLKKLFLMPIHRVAHCTIIIYFNLVFKKKKKLKADKMYNIAIHKKLQCTFLPFREETNTYTFT